MAEQTDTATAQAAQQDGAPTGQQADTGTTATATQTQQTQPGGQAGGERTPRTYTDQEVNDLIAREKRKLQESQEIKDLRAKAKRAEELEAAQLSEQEKLAKERDQFKTMAEQRAEKYRAALVASEFMAQAPGKGIPADRLKAAMKLADTSRLTVNEETDAVEGMAEVLDALVKDHPFLIANDRPPAPDINAGGGRSTPDPEARRQELERKFPAAFR